MPPKEIIQHLTADGLLAGVDLGRYQLDLDDCLLVAVTEKRTKEQIDRLIAGLEKFAS